MSVKADRQFHTNKNVLIKINIFIKCKKNTFVKQIINIFAYVSRND